MDAKDKKLVELRTTLRFYRKLEAKLQKVLDAELHPEEWHESVWRKIKRIQEDLEDHKSEMELPDDQWDEDEPKDPI